MATKYQKDQIVKLVAVVPQGPVQAMRMDENGVIYYLVGWTDAGGEPQQRWFAEEELTAV